MSRPSTYNSTVLFRIAFILASTLLGLFVAQSLNPFFPAMYFSAVTLQIKDLQNPPRFKGGDRPNPIYQEFLAKEFQRIRSKEILYPVIDSLQLEKRWSKNSGPLSKENTYRSLTTEIRISAIRNTELVQISVTGTNPNEAAEIANAIAQEYQRRRSAEQNEQISADLKKLEEEIARQREKTEALRVKAAAIKNQEGEASEAYQKARAEYEAARRIYEEAEQRLQTDRINTLMPANPATIWEKAEPAATSISAPPIVRLALGALLGAILGGILSLFVKRK